MYVLKGFPLSPSSNELYASFNGRHIKTRVGRAYDVSANNYLSLNHKTINKIKESIVNKQYLKVDAYFVIYKSRYNRVDVTNRLKAAHDNLAKMIGVDDRYFISCNAVKLKCEELRQEQIVFVIEEIKDETLFNYENIKYHTGEIE